MLLRFSLKNFQGNLGALRPRWSLLRGELCGYSGSVADKPGNLPEPDSLYCLARDAFLGYQTKGAFLSGRGSDSSRFRNYRFEE
jgi:hypothetical protein